MVRAGIPHIGSILLVLGCASGCPRAPVDPAPQARRITILATNDFHGAFHEERRDDGTAVGGAGALAAAIEAVRAEVGADRTLLVDGGDLFQGTPLVNATQGLASVELFNRLKYDAVAVGNHEFDYRGPPGDLRAPLEAAAAAATFPFLTANTVHEADRTPFTAPGIQGSLIVERGGIRIGLLGLTTESTRTSTHPENVVGLRFEPVHEVAVEVAADLRTRGAEVVIALAHVTGSCAEPPARGVDDPPRCTLTSSELEKLTRLPAGTLDVIVAGHQNQVMHHRYGSVFVMEQAFNGRRLGRLDLVLGEGGVDLERSRVHPPIRVEGAAREPECGDLGPEGGSTASGSFGDIDRWLAAREAELGLGRCDVVGCLARPASLDRETQSAAGTFVAEALLRAWEADVALQNGGGIRAPLPAGPVTAPALFRMLPFENTLVRMELSGAQLKQILRLGTSGGGPPMQVAGLDYGWDSERRGNRLCWVRVGGEPLDAERRYRVLMNDYMAAGGLDFPGIAQLPREEGPRLRDVVRDALREAGDRCLDPGEPAASQVAFRTSCP